MMNLHSIRAAKRAAIKRQFGSRWLVFTWDALQGKWDVSVPMYYRDACGVVRRHRIAVVRAGVEGR
jgi:hypothetical protein